MSISCHISPYSDDVGVVYMRFACEDIAISWRHLSTNCVAAILNTGLTPKTPSPTWNGSKLSTRRFVASYVFFPIAFQYVSTSDGLPSTGLLTSSFSVRPG